MRYFAIVLGCLLLFSCQGKVDQELERQKIEAMVRELARDFEKADIEAFVGRGTDDMRFFTLDGRSLDKNEAVEFLQPMFRRWSDRRMKIDSLSVYVGQEYGLARYQATFSFISTQPNVLKGLYTAVFRRTPEGNWRLLHFHMSRFTE